MTDRRTTSPPPSQDGLIEAYHRASELTGQASRPSQAVRDRILAQAEAQARLQSPPAQVGTRRPAANESRWKLRALASVMVMGLAGLLAWQVERAPPEPDQAPAATAALPEATREALQLPPAQTTTPADVGVPTGEAPLSAEAAPARRMAQPVPPAAPAPQSAKAAPQADAPMRQQRAATSVDAAGPAAAVAAAPAAAPATVPAAVPPAAADPFPASVAPTEPTERVERVESAESADRLAPQAAARSTAKSAAAPSPAAAPLDSSARDTASALASAPMPLWRAAAAGNADAVRAALASGTSANATDADGRPALVIAVVQGDGGPRHQDVVRALIAAGADPARTDRQGLSAIDHARRLGQSGMLQALQAPR